MAEEKDCQVGISSDRNDQQQPEQQQPNDNIFVQQQEVNDLLMNMRDNAPRGQ